MVGGIDYSARYYAAAASASAGSASASKDGAATSATNAGNSATLAQQWAVAAGLVGGVDYSAKYYANAAAISAANAASAFGNALAKAANLSDVADAAAARGNLSAAKSGANSDITGLSALTSGITQKAAAGAVTNTMSSPAGSVRTTLVQTANANRWQWGVDSTAEGGANAGSKFFISRYSDAGALIDNPVVIDRATGAATFSVRPIFAGQTPYDTGNFNPAAYLPLTARAATSSKLFISGTGDASFAWAGQGGQPTWLFGSNDGINCYIWNPSNFSVNWANSSNYANSAGSVGGVSTPAKSVGNLFSFQWDGGSGNVNITVDSTFVAFVHANVSDARLKENIKPSTVDSLALIEQIEFKEFDFKTGRHVKTGLIAQDVEKFASHWIQAHNNGQFEDARFTHEQAMLFDAMHAIQQLSKRLKALEDQSAATEPENR
ncbi:tail fiber domain-containing protein [Paraburkholderia terrae]|uniref:tail fiber domain-containing protein n=1 Tax=Paraburkholderia terrae TaxID=311230 RepID=UPI001EE360EF|nr:tail fiber domain-containing protein [Paraburkholderia terrae]GJH00215.1 hypothetical protein CBA19C8_06680 [Paraburkholderia terrae]